MRRLAPCGLALVLLALSCGARRLGAGEAPPPAPEALVPVTIRDVTFDAATQTPVVILETAAKDRVLLVVIGHGEAIAILRQLRKLEALPRPMTHDLLKDVIERLGGKLERIVITRIEDGTFYAELVIERGGTRVRIDSRPSDAMALALRAGAAILVAKPVLDEAGIEPDKLPKPEEPKPRERFDPDQAI